MQISADKVVGFHYNLTDVDGTLLETSYDTDPTLYLHGHKNILPALEDHLEGKSVGDKIKITVTPEQAYGERKEGAVQRIPIKHLHNHSAIKNKLKPGSRVSVNTQNGPWEAVVLKVGKFNVDIDSNHPLAGKTLNFDIEVSSIREATAEELAHGHAHGAGGHNHS
ncbi:MAG: peptidylprolyl isomerase [Gammaproteobacteria bacterium]|nr:MAG: peptidylprolyl isomerase [Gammaproteobacteria bacterium]